MLSARQQLVRPPLQLSLRMVDRIRAWGQIASPRSQAAGHAQCISATVRSWQRGILQSHCPASLPLRHNHGKGLWRLRTSQNSTSTAAVEGQLAPSWSLYNEPQLYDEVFNFRDFPKEVAFLFDAMREHGGCAPWPRQSNGGPALQSFLEIGCGPARHLLEAAKQGASYAVGIDSNPHMIRYAESLAERAEAAGGKRASFYCMDATEIGGKADLQEAFDLALLPLGTLAHALTNSDAIGWLRAARGCLREGGLLCVELAHPGDVFDGTLVEGDEWDVVASNGEALHVTYGSALDDFDPVAQRVRRNIAVDRTVDTEAGTELVGEEEVEQRVFTLAEVELLGELAGFGRMSAYGDYDMAVGLGDENAYRLVMLMQRPCS